MFGGILAFIDKDPTWGRWCEYPKMGGGGWYFSIGFIYVPPWF